MKTIQSYDKYLIYMDNNKTHKYTWSQFNFAYANLSPHDIKFTFKIAFTLLYEKKMGEDWRTM